MNENNNPSRAGEISPAFPRWVKASERLPETPGKYPCKENGEYFTKYLSSKYSGDKSIEWLEEAPPTPAPKVKEDKDDDERPGCFDGTCSAPKGYTGLTNCLECGGELRQVGNFWYHHTSFDDGKLVEGAQVQDVVTSKQVKDTPVEQKKAYAGLIDICSRSGMYTYVCPCEIHNNSGESPTEQPAQVPDPKGEIPEETEGIIEAIKDIQKRPFSATAKIMQAYADQKIATLTQQRDAALIAAQAHRQCLQVCVQGLRESGLPMAAEPIQAYLDKFPS